MNEIEYKKYGETVSIDEHFENLERGDADALAYEKIHEQSKEVQELRQQTKDMAEKIKRLVFNPLEWAVFEKFVLPEYNSSLTARVVIGKMKIKEVKELLPKIVQAQSVAHEDTAMPEKKSVKPRKAKSKGSHVPDRKAEKRKWASLWELY